MGRFTAVLLLVAGAATAGDGAWPRFQAGVRAYNRKEFGAAEKHFEAVVTADPNFGDAYYYLGVLHERKGDRRRAVQFFKAVEKKWPTFVLSQERLGQMALRMKRPKVAEQYFLVVAKNAPALNSWMQLANVQVDLAKYKEAEKCLQECMKFSKNNLTVVELLARLYVETDRFSEAYDAYSKVLKVMPRDSNVRFMRALCLQEMKRKREAVRELEEILKMAPFHQGALLRLLDMYEGDASKARRVEAIVKRLEQIKKNPPRVRVVSGSGKNRRK